MVGVPVVPDLLLDASQVLLGIVGELCSLVISQNFTCKSQKTLTSRALSLRLLKKDMAVAVWRVGSDAVLRILSSSKLPRRTSMPIHSHTHAILLPRKTKLKPQVAA